MTHPNHQTNGASLEDCHTNFFALTELCGIKWRKLVWGECGFSAEPLEDPVLASYARCLAMDILCVWRRVATQAPSPSSAGAGALFDSMGLPPGLGGPGSGGSMQQPPLSLHAAKELWIFWYGEPPDLSGIVAPELMAAGDGEVGSWESGLSYECRSLLFKALHNLIERCLLSRDFVRLGKWFVQPYDGSEKLVGASIHFSFSFAFFVHGESTVCASIDVRTHPLVHGLTRQHLQAAQACGSGLPVLLAPFGLAGSLTGAAYKGSDVQMQRLLEDWRQFYPIDCKLSRESPSPDEAGLPLMVEVLVGGMKMRYPACYVLVTDMDEVPAPAAAAAENGGGTLSPGADMVLKSGNAAGVGVAAGASTTATTAPGAAAASALCTPPSSPNPGASLPTVQQPPHVLGGHHPASMQHNPSPASLLPEHVWQDATLNPTQHDRSLTPGAGAATPSSAATTAAPATTTTTTTTTTSTTGGNGGGGGDGGGAGGGGGGGGGSGGCGEGAGGGGSTSNTGGGGSGAGDASEGAAAATAPPGHWDFVDPTRKALCSCSKLAAPATVCGGPPCYSRAQSMTPNPLPSLQGGSGGGGPLGDSVPVPSVGSPASAAPSPLPNPHSQPASVPPPDSTMPTLSPHPPASNSAVAPPHQPATPIAESQDKIATPVATPSDLNGPKSVSSVSNQVFSPYPLGSSGEPLSKAVDSMVGSQGPASIHSAPPIAPPVLELPVLKRPVLSSRDYENILMEEEQPSKLLYDYSTLDAWLDHPVKRFKPSEPRAVDAMRPPQCPRVNGTESFGGLPLQSPTSPASGTIPFIKQEIKQEHGCSMAMDVDSNVPNKRSDPYEFEDDMAAPVASMEEFKEFKRTIIKEEDRKGVPGNPATFDPVTANGPTNRLGSLFTSEGLQASYQDLEQIFDNSESSSDEALQVPTPPGSNKPAGLLDDAAATSLAPKAMRGSSGNTSLNGCSGTGILRPEELSKMFPTPPSMEHNPISSPCGQLSDGPTSEVLDGTSGLLVPRIKQEIYPNLGSPPEENIEDWSYVFRPPVMCKFVGSSKYAPLTNLPSQTLPPVTLPAHCVYKPSRQYNGVSSLSEKTAPSSTHMISNNSNSRPSSVSSGQHVHHPLPSHTHHPPLPHPPNTNGPFPPSPMMGGVSLHLQPQQFRGSGSGPGPTGGARTPCPPSQPYELSSPATSTASSYLNKNLNSVEAVTTPVLAHMPEANALVVNLLLGDTALNIFRDHNFDSCTLCVCNAGPKVVGNIRGADAAVYLPAPPPPPIQQPPALPYPPNSPFPGLGMNGPPPPYGMLGSSPSGHHGVPGAAITGNNEEDSICCTCGFSAVVNRRLSHRSGLFYEDEMEITGIAEDPAERKKGSLMAYLLASGVKPVQENNGGASASEIIDSLPQNVIELVREQCVIVQSTSNSIFRASRMYHSSSSHSVPYGTTVNVLEFSDSNEVACAALEQGRQAMVESTVAMCKVEEMQQRQQLMAHSKGLTTPCVHRWPHLRARGPHCNQDIVRVMKNLQPLLQEAIQKKCTTRLWDAPYTVSGPLTWRKFHRLAGRGTDDRCEPQPIPSLVVGYDKDWLSLSPYAVHYWEKLLLEPYSYARDIAYIVVAPDNEYVLQRVRTFFKELSATYEVCRLGRHCPITKVLRDGILRVGKTAAVKLAKEPVDEWFTMLGDSPATNMLRLYAQVCRHHLAPHLSQVPMDKSLLEPAENAQNRSSIDRPLPSPMPPPSTPESGQLGEKAPSTPKSDHDGDGGSSGRESLAIGGIMTGSSSDSAHDDDCQEPPAIVVYLVDPFTMGSDSSELQRLACLGLLRCFTTVLASVPDSVRSNISVQIISLESIVELGKSRDRVRHNDHMRAQAFSVFAQCRRLLSHTSSVKALTGFGTAAMADLFLKSKDEKNRQPYRLYAPPYVLAPVKDKNELSESFGQLNEGHCSVLYVSYCLSEDQRWLLAVATDERGEIFETATINIDIPNRIRRKKASARRVGLQKLMDFILGVMSQSIQPWRLVVGRVGRMGHGELKGWSWLLSRKSLIKASKHLKDICNQCSLMYPTDVPCVLSACLVSLEPDSTLRLMPDQFTPDERFSQASVNCQLSTPQDMSCTHILVFPTSATTQSSQTAFQEQHINGPDLDDDLFTVLNDEGIDGMQNFDDIFTWPETGPGGVQSPTGSPRREDSLSQPGSPSCGLPGASDQQSPYPACNGSSRTGGRLGGDTQEEVGTLHQQPLALGYFVSTAPTGRMPRWFWASCPHLEDVCPAFLKNALHLHSPSIQQNDDMLQQSTISVHPLDSQYTTDVLRYVLEGYNALSWLALDSNTHDRLSCLPVHVQALMQLYHMTSALV